MKTKESKQTVNEGVTQLIPQEDYLQSLYAITRHWHSDTIFFTDEISFFRLLIDKHLALMIDPKNINQTRDMLAHLAEIERELTSLQDLIDQHLKHLAKAVEKAYAEKLPNLKEEHGRIEIDFQDYVKKFRAVKREVYKLTERVIQSDKARRMIDWA